MASQCNPLHEVRPAPAVTAAGGATPGIRFKPTFSLRQGLTMRRCQLFKIAGPLGGAAW